MIANEINEKRPVEIPEEEAKRVWLMAYIHMPSVISATKAQQADYVLTEYKKRWGYK